MNRRAFLSVLAGGVFVPKLEPWYRRFGGLWSREASIHTVTLGGIECNRIWRKVQGELRDGFTWALDLEGWRVYP